MGISEQLPDHMPRDHRKYVEFDKGFILEWGAATGPLTLLTIEKNSRILSD